MHHSFSFNSMYIDMPRWSTCKIPVLKDMDLHTFWGSSALRVAAYYLLSSDSAAGTAAAAGSTGTTASGSSGVSQAVQHLQKDLRYLLCIQVQHTTAADAAAAAAAAASSETQGSEISEEDAVPYRSKVKKHAAQFCTLIADTCSQQLDAHADHQQQLKIAHGALCMLL
jgi:hypothetical protein